LRIKPLTNDDVNCLPTRFQRQVITTNPTIPNSIIVQGEKKQVFSYDYVFGPESTQEEVYTSAIVKLVENFLEGYNVTILAYGQTSSGKTHTMGTADNSSISLDSKGIIPRAMETLFSSMNSLQCKNQKFSIKVSFIEIYNEDLIDLLGEGDMESRSQVTIREDSKGNILWNGLQEINVNGVDDVMSHLARGSMNRQVGATEMNSKSSRSHAIFSVIMAQQKYVGSPMTPSSAPPRPATPSRLSESSKIARSSSNLNLRMSRRFDEEVESNNHHHQGVISGFSSASDEEKLLLSSIAPGALSLKDEQDRLIVTLEKKNVINGIEFDKSIETLQNNIKDLEEQLFKAKELRSQFENEKSQSGECVRPLQISKEVAAEMIAL
ncbi:2104_t:CDS:2, partial [Dentiscutata heterogama]